MARSRKVDALREVPLFGACTPKELRRIAAIADEIDQPAGTVLVTQGKPGREMFVVASGTVKVARSGRTIARLGAGEVVGEMALLDQGPRTATVTAETDVSLYVISARDFSTLLRDVPTVAIRILKAVAARLRMLEKGAYH